MPEVVAARLAGVWAEARAGERGLSTSGPVEGWRAQVEQVEAERDEAITAADELAVAAQHDADQAAEKITAFARVNSVLQTTTIESLRHDLDAAHTERAEAREGAAGARGEATVLREEVARLRGELETAQ